MRWWTIAAWVLALSLIFVGSSSCGGAYQRTIRDHGGSHRPNAKVARVVVPAPAFVTRIDGRPMSARGRRFTVVDFAPGEHSLEVIFRQVIPSGSVTVTRTSGPNAFKIDAEAGKLYIVHSVVAGDKVAQFLAGPYPLEVTVPGSGRRIFLDRAPGSEPSDLTDNFCFAVQAGGKRTTYPTFLVPDQIPAFSEDGKHVAFFVYHGRGDRQWIVDGVPQPKHFEALRGPLKFSDDGSRFVYLAQNGRVVSLVVDGKVTPLNGRTVSIDGFEFSPGGSHYAYLARVGDKRAYIVVDGEELGPFQDSFAPTYTSKKGQLIFFARAGNKWRFYLNGQKSPLGFDEEPPAIVVFDSGENRFAYAARIGDRFALVMGGKVGPAYHDLSIPMFSPNDAHLVYLAKDKNQDKDLVVADGEIIGTYDEIDYGSLGFSEDSATLFFKIRKNDAWVIKELRIAPEDPPQVEQPDPDSSGGAYVEQPAEEDTPDDSDTSIEQQ